LLKIKTYKLLQLTLHLISLFLDIHLMPKITLHISYLLRPKWKNKIIAKCADRPYLKVTGNLSTTCYYFLIFVICATLMWIVGKKRQLLQD